MAVINHLRLNSVGPSDSLFSVRSPSAQSTQPITYYHFSKFLAKVVTALGFPEIWKEALVFPLLKKPGLDVIFKNFRPVSNLSFVSKLIERAAFNQIHGHLVRNNLYPVAQSAYRRNHSTETALLKVMNDILLNMNKQHVTILVLLDLRKVVFLLKCRS